METYPSRRLTNELFLQTITHSFDRFIEKGTSRSTYKLKPLHGAIAEDIANRLGDNYIVWSQGYSSDRESYIKGRYFNKKSDITIKDKRTNKTVAGIAVKFVMQNYSQNSNNYFENMLGETANIRCADYPYFQVFIILDRLPYYNKSKAITKWESFTDNNASKYITLSHDNIDRYFHTPNKTLIYVVHLPDVPDNIDTHDGYRDFYRNNPHELSLSSHIYPDFGRAVILNDYETFIDKVYYTIKSL